MVCSSCSSLDGLLQKCSRKLHFHLARGSICGAARAPSIPETLLSCLDKKVKLIQIKNIKRFFPASSATLGTFPAPHLHQDCCSLSPALPAKAGTSRDAERVTSNLILKLYLARFFPPWSSIPFFWMVVFNCFIYHCLMACYCSALRDLKLKYEIVE